MLGVTRPEPAGGTALGQPAQTAVFGILAAVLVLAPLFRSGQPPLARLLLELLAVAMLALVWWRPPRALLARGEIAALGLLAGFPLLYLLPLPGAVAHWLPGREPYLASFSLLGIHPAPHLSVVPLQTESAFLTLLVPVAVFLATRMLPSTRLVPLALVLIGVGAVEAVLGLMQYGGGGGSLLYLGMDYASAAVGTYTNRNHLAGLIEMILPIALGLFLYSLGRGHRDHSRGWRERVSFYGSVRGHLAFVYGALALLLLVGVIFTRSRAGIALTMLGILLATFAFARRLGGDNVYGPTGSVVAIAVGVGIVIGLAPVLDRFSQLDPMEDARWTIFSATLDGIGAFFPLGSGPGDYATVFPTFQPVELGRWFINQAHNDYLQWVFEGGLPAALLIALLIGLYVLRWRDVWTRDAWSRFRFVQVGAGIGILLLLLHELVDYNLHMPANMVYFAFLAGIFFADAGKEVEADRSKRRKRRHRESRTSEPAVTPAARAPLGPHPDQIPNPFED